MRLTPDADRVRAAAIASSTSNITAAEFDRFVAKTKADAKRELLAELMSDESCERARKLVEDELIEWRDSCLSILGRGNGLAIRSKDGTPSSIIRFGFETGWKMSLKDHADKLDVS